MGVDVVFMVTKAVELFKLLFNKQTFIYKSEMIRLSENLGYY